MPDRYEVILDEKELDQFLAILPEPQEGEVFYLSLFGRHKYCPTYPNMRDESQLHRFIAKREHIKEKIRRLECPVGSYKHNGIAVPQEAMALYIALNPRSLAKANKELLCELARRISDGDSLFNPISMATTVVHRATGRKCFADFDFDDVNPYDCQEQVKDILSKGSYMTLKTRGGCHIIVDLRAEQQYKDWYKRVAALPKCDVKGTQNLTPVPGCCQGNFSPFFI